MIKFSIIIPTFSRNKLLNKLLESIILNNSTYEKNKNLFEIIVVDNNKDKKAKYITNKYKDICYIHEKKEGVSFARNSGAKKATGKYLIFLDDDEYIDKFYLKEVLKFSGTAAIGKTELYYEEEKPKWIISKLENYFSKINYGKKSFILNKNHWITAGNLILTKEYFHKIGGFNTKIQRVGTTLLGNEDIILKKELELNNINIEYIPNMKVFHFVPKERTKFKWLKKRAYYQGVSDKVFHKLYNINTNKIECKNNFIIKICNFVLLFKKFIPFFLLNSILILKYSKLGYLKEY